MAVFTRPATRSQLTQSDFDYVGSDQQMLDLAARQRPCSARSRVSTCCCTGRRVRARPSSRRWRRRPASCSCTRWNTPIATATRSRGATATARCRFSQVFLKGRRECGVCCSTKVEDVFPPISTDAAQLMARMDTGDGALSGSVSGKAWVNQILETNPVPGDLDHEPHRADRPGLSAPLPVPPRVEEPAAGARASS